MSIKYAVCGILPVTNFIKGQTVVIHTSNGTILLNKKYNITVDDLQAYYKQAYEARVITV